MKFNRVLLAFVSLVVLTACGDATETQRALLSSADLSGSYDLGLTSCTKGQFDPAEAQTYLKQNRVIQEGKIQVQAEMKDDEFSISGGSPFFGGVNASCTITKKYQVRFPVQDRISLKQTAELCSNTCTTTDCTQREKITGSDVITESYTFDANTLAIVISGSEKACILEGKTYSAQAIYIKK